MKMEVDKVSKDCIKPSSLTPCNLKNHKLSFLDLYLHPYYIPIVLYWTWIFPYPILILSFIKDCNTLKQSLSEALSLFYPFDSIILKIGWFIFISSRWCIPKRNMHGTLALPIYETWQNALLGDLCLMPLRKPTWSRPSHCKIQHAWRL